MKKATSILTISLLLASVTSTGIVLTNQIKKSREIDKSVCVVSFNTNGGSKIDPIVVNEGVRIKKPDDPIKNGFSLISWNENGKPWEFETYSVISDITLEAIWKTNAYTITYDFAGGTTEEEYETSYDVNSSFDLVTPSKTDALFGGWFDENNHHIESITAGMTGDIHLTAAWLERLVVTNLGETKAKVNVYRDEEDINKVVVESKPFDDKYHLFNGWYDENDYLLSDKDTYTFNLKDNEITYINAKYMNDEEEHLWNLSHGVTPSLDSDKNQITYGMYPQTYVSDSTLIAKLNSINRTYINEFVYYDHEYYFQKKSKLYANKDTGQGLDIHLFDNGNEIIDGTYYWYKLEPLLWRILKNNDDSFLLMSDKLLNSMKYYKDMYQRTIGDNTIFANNYKYSDLRKWLNESFFEDAFYFNESEILTTEIDNTKSSTGQADNPFICENTFDKVFELSYSEYLDDDYGFTSVSTRQALTTDFARASGVLYSTTDGNKYYGYIWTRSPYYKPDDKNKETIVSRINRGGGLNTCWNGADYLCAQPCITLNSENVITL